MLPLFEKLTGIYEIALGGVWAAILGGQTYQGHTHDVTGKRQTQPADGTDLPTGQTDAGSTCWLPILYRMHLSENALLHTHHIHPARVQPLPPSAQHLSTFPETTHPPSSRQPAHPSGRFCTSSNCLTSPQARSHFLPACLGDSGCSPVALSPARLAGLTATALGAEQGPARREALATAAAQQTWGTGQRHRRQHHSQIHPPRQCGYAPFGNGLSRAA